MRIIYLFIGFVLGVYVANNYDIDMFRQLPPLSSHSKHEAQSATPNSQVTKSTSTSYTVTTRAMCPPAETVRKQVGQQGPWKVNGLTWSFEALSWQPPEKIVFHQAFYYPSTQSINCDYTWQSPKDPTTKLWLRINLNLAADQNIKVAGSHWGDIGTTFLCTSALPETCAFDIVNP